MDIGERVITLDGSDAIIVSVSGAVARVCYLTPDGRLSYIAAAHLLANLRPTARRNRKRLAA